MSTSNTQTVSLVPVYPPKHECTLETDGGATPIPRNLFVKPQGRNVFNDALEEQHALEQFFWTQETVAKLMKACQYTAVEKTCCLMTPSMAHGWHEQEEPREEVLLDIDKRFDYLPKFRYFDATNPLAGEEDDDFRLLIIDPPFFLIPIEQVRRAVDVLTGGNFQTRILIAFLKRGEARLRRAFAPYGLRPTHFPLQYTSIKPNKWNNFVLYSNIDLPGIKRFKEGL